MACGRGGRCIFMDRETSYLITVVSHSVLLGYLNYHENISTSNKLPCGCFGENERRPPIQWLYVLVDHTEELNEWWDTPEVFRHTG